MQPSSNFVRTLVICVSVAVSASWWSIAARATGTGQSFTFLASPFTQDLYGASGNLLDTTQGILGGVAFAPNGDVWSSECYFYGTRLHRFNSHLTILVNGTQIHPEAIVDISDVGPYGVSGALPYGAGGCGLVNHPDGYIYSNSMFGIWKLDASTGLPVDPSSNPPNQPIDPNGPPPVGGGLVGGANAQPGNALGLAIDPQVDGAGVHHLVYVGADCHPTLSPGSGTCTLWDLDPSTGVTTVFARLSRAYEAFVDGLYFDPSGNFLFAAHRDDNNANPQNSLQIVRRPATLQPANVAVDDTQIAREVLMTSEPDGVAFHAQQGFVVTLNESDDPPPAGSPAGTPRKGGTMTRFDFPAGDYSAVPTQTEFASGGFRGDLLQVGSDGCIYATQGRLFARVDEFNNPVLDATRYDDGTTDAKNSIVQICGGFAVPPGVHAEEQAQPGSISGTVYEDRNHNGVHDSGEPGIGGVTVSLTVGPGGSTTTAVDGTYSFSQLNAGDYSVSSPATASGLQLFTPSPLSFTLAAAENKSNVDFGYVSGSIAGFAYVDLNRNNTKDSGEPGIPNVLITLGGDTTASGYTQADGSYKFNLIAPGQYTSAAPSVAAAKALETPSSLTVAVGLGQDKTDVNFGYVPGGLSGFVYVDTNRNSMRDGGEPGIGGVVVTLTGGPGGTATTLADGSYSFTNLDAGSFGVTAPTSASGKALETTSPLTASVTAGQNTPDVNFGYVPGGLSGFVYVDTNRNSVRDGGEPGIGAVVVTLTGGPGGTATTLADGSYSFTNLDAGSYTVGAPTTASGKALETTSPLTASVTAGQNTPNVNFGYVPGGLSGFVYVDTNRNSMRDSGEPGIGGVIVSLAGGGTATTLADGSYGFANLNAGTYSVGAPATAAGNNLETPSPLGPTVAAGLTTPNVNFGYVTPTPRLTLAKSANSTTYSYIGQIIVYTYVIQNTGDVTVSGPFTVTDDKLGAFQCGTATTLVPGGSVTCTKNYVIQARDLGTVAALPTGVAATVNTGGWLQGVMSTQDTTISAAGPGVPDGVYPGWCIQDHVAADLHNQPATLYSSIGGSLPADVAGLPWSKINYVLNHKIRGAGKSDLAFFKDVQTAIWRLLGEPNPDFGVSATAQQMIDEANAHPTFVPGSTDVVAVIVYSDGMGTAPGSIQESIIEMKPLQSITNHAVAAGTVGTVTIPSNQAQFTASQIIQTVPTPSGTPGQVPTVDKTVYSEGSGKQTTQPFSTTIAGDVLVAFATSDGPTSGGQQVTVAGAGLTWTLVKRANTQLGTAEIWKARATGTLSNVTVSSTQKYGGYHQALVVVMFTGATGVGASASAGAMSGAPSATLTTTKANSFVYGVGNDWDHANGRVLGPNQLMVHQWVDSETGDTHWVQARAAGVPAVGTVVQLNDTAPTSDRWNFAIVEVVK